MKQTLAIFLAVILTVFNGFAGSATWKSSPTSGDWNTATNWTPQTVPNEVSDVATLQQSNVTSISTSAATTGTNVGDIVFDTNASTFTITAGAGGLSIHSTGIINNSGTTQHFISKTGIAFSASASAGEDTSFLVEVTSQSASIMDFFDSSSAGQASIAIQPTQNGITGGGEIFFFGSATAGNGTFTLAGSAVSTSGVGGAVGFGDGSTAGAGIFTLNGGTVPGAGGAEVFFTNNAKAGTSTLIANGGSNGGNGGFIKFAGHSHGGKARIELFGNSNLDISAHGLSAVKVGSIEGTGTVFLGARNLTVGSNNLDTSLSGGIMDGGAAGGTGGSLSKIGTGAFSLRNSNTYTGGTIVNKGTLIVRNAIGSGTGPGPVQVNAGTLAGTGIISGAVTIGTGSGAGAFLSPGNIATKPGALTIQNMVVLNADSTYKAALNRATPTATKLTAMGVTINGAQFAFADFNSGTLTPGTVFTVINNTSANPIAGTFANLPDGATFTSNGTTFKANYAGGDGNALTLTVQ